jgi:hypothetical protein
MLQFFFEPRLSIFFVAGAMWVAFFFEQRKLCSIHYSLVCVLAGAILSGINLLISAAIQ